MSSNNQDDLMYKKPLDKNDDEDKSMNRSNSENNWGESLSWLVFNVKIKYRSYIYKTKIKLNYNTIHFIIL